MRRTLRQLGLAGSLGAVALMLPLRLEQGVTATRVRVNDACGQATECTRASDYICSTFNQDWQDYKCSQGCGPKT